MKGAPAFVLEKVKAPREV